MKKLIILTAIFLTYFVTTTNAAGFGFGFRFYHHHHSYVNDNYFFNVLEPYGEWIEIEYDEYAWRPYDVDYNWKPYSIGRWEWTRSGWYWVSYEPFGWATYHYGRWFYDNYYGWLWMPANKWAPAWVEWRYNDNYIGWAPLPPYARFNPHRGIRFTIRWNSGYNYWNFVSYNHFTTVNIHNYYINNYEVRNIFKRTKYRTNYYENNNTIVNGGINKRFVEKRSGVRIRTKEIRRTNSVRGLTKRTKINRREVISYRPNKSEIKKFNSFDRSKIKRGKTLKSLRHDKIAIRNVRGREINKTNRRSVKNRRTDLRKPNKNYKPLVRKSERPNKIYRNEPKPGNRIIKRKDSSFRKVNPIEKENNRNRILNKRKLNTNKRSTIRNKIKRIENFSRHGIERNSKSKTKTVERKTKRREVIKRR